MEKIIEFRGKRQSLKKWAEEIGMSDVALRKRLQRGMSVEEALTRPKHITKFEDSWRNVKNPNSRRPIGCCVPDCENCPLPDCEFNGCPTKEEGVYIKLAHKRLPDWPGGMNHQYPTFTGVQV